MIKLYFHTTPNPMKVALFLEEAGLEYEVIPVDTLKGDQHSPAFRKINPNGKVPAIVDGETVVFDSNAILLYLADKTGKFLGQPADRGQLLSWLMFIASGLGPFSGQAVHFQRMAPEQVPYAVNRYRREAERHYAIVEDQLAGKPYLLGPDYTIVDMAGWGWIDRSGFVLGESALDAYPNIKRWMDSINARPAVARARGIGQKQSFKTTYDEEAFRNLFPSNYAAA